MNFIEQLNAHCRRLARDESGVVLAFTIIIFLSLFVIACSVYGVGENIRERIELQNAADAAAYSAAVVQADAVSRIAAINKALAWTHVQMGRAVMDYDVDVWLEWTIKKWSDRNQDVSTWVSQGNCPTYWVGESSQGQILINKSQTKSIMQLQSMWAGGSKRPKIKQTIDDSRKAIQDMNKDESDIISNLKSHLQDVVQEVISQDTGTPDATYFQYSLQVGDAKDYFKTLSDESILLKYFDSPKTAKDVFQDGVDVWFNLKSGSGSDGIQRDYEQQSSSLVAEWHWSGLRWLPCDEHPCCVMQYYHGQVIGQDSDDIVTGEKAKNWGGQPDDYYQTEPVKAQILTSDFFDQKGGIVVGVVRKLQNPLLFMLGDNTAPGLYAFFDPAPGGTAYTCAAAASRAGYRDGGGDGEYWTKDPGGWVSSEKNLSQWDWDGELVPLPWFTSPSGVMNSSTWQSLDQKGDGGSSLSGSSSPSGSFLH